MQKLKKKKHIKGSTLLLAMVVISTVLFAGIGVATILSRQIKEIPLVENETRGFYIAETIADMMNKNDLEEADCEGINVGNQDIECSAEKVNDEYHVVVKVGGNYYKFVKKAEGNLTGGGGEESIEGMITAYFQTKPWANWSPLYIYYRLNPDGPIVYSFSDLKKMKESSFYEGWHYFEEIDPNFVEGKESVTVRFFTPDDGGGNIVSGSFTVTKENSVFNVRERGASGGRLDIGPPITVFFNDNGEWDNAYIYVREDNTYQILIDFQKAKMYDVSDKYGDNWYVFYPSFEGYDNILLRFHTIINGQTSGTTTYTGISRDNKIINMTKGDSSVKIGYPE